MTDESKLETFRDAVASYLSTSTDQLGGVSVASLFTGVPIFVFKQGDQATKLLEAFNSSQVFGEVRIQSAKVKISQCKDVLIDGLDFVVDFYENVLLNQGTGGTGKGAWLLAETCLRALNYQRIAPFPHTITPGAPALEDMTKDPDSGQCTVRARFTTKIELPAFTNANS